MLGIVESIVVQEGQGVRFRRGEGGDGRGSTVHSEGRVASKRFFVGYRVVGEKDALRERGLAKIIRRREKFH